MIGAVLSAKLATIVEVQTILSLEDVYKLYDLVLVDAHNAKVIDDRKEKN